jgi:hypothetical protein
MWKSEMTKQNAFEQQCQIKLLQSGDQCEPGSQTGSMEHDPDWVLAQCDQPDKSVLLFSNPKEGDIPIFVHRVRLDYRLGEWSIGGFYVTRYVIVGGLNYMSEQSLTTMINLLAGYIKADGVIFLLGLVSGEPLWRFLSDPFLKKHFLVLPHGPAYSHRLIRLEDCLETYLKSIDAKHRNALRRTRRKFEEAYQGRFSFEVYTSREDIRSLIGAIEPVSNRTYQSRLLGIGIKKGGHIANQLEEGARRGYARCYLLKVDSSPVSWRLGYVYGATYYSHHIGYDPNWRHWNPGILIHMAVIEDLLSHCRQVRTLDLLYGDSLLKRRLSNQSREERHFYLFPRHARGILSYWSLRVVNSISQGFGGLLRAINKSEQVKLWLRRRAEG